MNALTPAPSAALGPASLLRADVLALHAPVSSTRPAQQCAGEHRARGGGAVRTEMGGARVHAVDEQGELGAIVNLSSGAGSHGDDQFDLTRRGGSAATYGISKAALNALTATLAAELAGTPILVNAVCPGLTATWPGAEAIGARPVPDGAASVVWGATLPADVPRGGLFRDGKPLAW